MVWISGLTAGLFFSTFFVILALRMTSVFDPQKYKKRRGRIRLMSVCADTNEINPA